MPNNMDSTALKALKNNVKMLDLAWFGITRKYNESKMRILLELTILNRAIKKYHVQR